MRVADLPPHMRALAREKLRANDRGAAAAAPPRPAVARSAARATREPSAPNRGVHAPLRLVVPLPPQATNTGGHGASRHWSVGNREKRQYWATLDVIATHHRLEYPDGAVYTIPDRPNQPLHRVEMCAHCVVASAHDDVNMTARMKALEDWLVARCYLATDRRERKRDGAGCRWVAPPTQTVTRTQPARVELTITAVEA